MSLCTLMTHIEERGPPPFAQMSAPPELSIAGGEAKRPSRFAIIRCRYQLSGDRWSTAIELALRDAGQECVYSISELMKP